MEYIGVSTKNKKQPPTGVLFRSEVVRDFSEDVIK